MPRCPPTPSHFCRPPPLSDNDFFDDEEPLASGHHSHHEADSSGGGGGSSAALPITATDLRSSLLIAGYYAPSPSPSPSMKVPTLVSLSSLFCPKPSSPFFTSGVFVVRVEMVFMIARSTNNDFLEQFNNDEFAVPQMMAVIVSDNSAEQVSVVLPTSAFNNQGSFSRLDGGCPLSSGDILVLSGVFVALMPICHLVCHESTVMGVLRK